MEYVNRTYRTAFSSADIKYFDIKIKETDLCIGIGSKDYSQEVFETAYKGVAHLRNQLEHYISLDPGFEISLVPYEVKNRAPAIAKDMSNAAMMAKVGPMAAVAGAFAQYIGQTLLKYSSDIIVENGGDLYICTTKKRVIGIFAGESPFSNKIGIEIIPEMGPIGLCTSSGTVGPSLSFGRADAAVIMAKKNAILADAAATAVGNIVKTVKDIEGGVELASNISGIFGAVVIKDDKMAVWGDIKIVPLSN
ncbi:MAG: UPF0280 family protein [Ignavibacteriales bacterium]